MTMAYPANRYRTKFVFGSLSKFDETLRNAVAELGGSVEIISAGPPGFDTTHACVVIEYLLPEKDPKTR